MASLGSYENESNAKHTISTSIGGRCEDPSCFASKLTSPLPKRRSAQFFSAPVVVEKPVLVRGLTSAFQVHGSSAKFADLKNPNDDDSAKTIYRVVPNTHVHVVNYVVVDTDEEDLSKISNADPNAPRKPVFDQMQAELQELRRTVALLAEAQASSQLQQQTTVQRSTKKSRTNTTNNLAS
uniref:Uncharacterized protein n=1 Tax=Glossina palpalis gambiensis TaxID=67801 RepID=A0A1B0BNH2_9MUSC